jgi:hypothetical protein
MNDDPRDRDLEEAYRDASRETPPPELDARILAAAHRAVRSRPEDAARRPGWVSRYRVPMSVAATAVIAVTVAFMVEDESRRVPEADAPLAAPRTDAPWGSRSAPAPAPAPAAVTPTAPKPAEAARSSAPAAAPPALRSAQERPTEAPKVEESATRLQREVANDAAATVAGPAPPPAPAPMQMESREREVQERPARMTRDEASGDLGRAASMKAMPMRSPEAWLADIRRLRDAGRLAEADEALAAFRRAYPDFVLPDDLRPR